MHVPESICTMQIDVNEQDTQETMTIATVYMELEGMLIKVSHLSHQTSKFHRLQTCTQTTSESKD